MTLMDKIYNFALNSTNMQQAIIFAIYYMLKKLLAAQKGVDIAPCPPPLNTPLSAPRLWNDQPPELSTFSLPPQSSSQITKHHLHAALSVTSGRSTRNSSSISSKTLTLTHLILFLPSLRINYTRLNA